jgi:hypothetical protein
MGKGERQGEGGRERGGKVEERYSCKTHSLSLHTLDNHITLHNYAFYLHIQPHTAAHPDKP